MPYSSKILTFAGSTREGSLNKKLACLVAGIVKQNNAQATFIDLKDYPLPLYDGDVEQQHPFPDSAKKLKALMASHDGWLIASPEYNSSITAVLKNTLDWITRSEDKSTDLTAIQGKTVAIVSASPGRLGGLRGLVHLRAILSNLGCMVLPNQLAISDALNAFDDTGALNDVNQSKQLYDIVMALLDVSNRLNK